MNPTSKILFTDLDNTLLNRQKQITRPNSQAIRQAIRQGHRIVLCTGRPLLGTLPLIERLSLTQPGCYAIAYNGGVIYNCFEKRIIFQKTLPLPYVKYIFDKARQYDLFCQTYSHDHLLAPGPSPALDAYLSRNKMPFRILPSLPDSLKEEPSKVLVIGLDAPEKLSAYRASLEEWAADKVSVFYSNPSYLEHVPLGVSKGAAIKWLCHRLDIPLSRTVAIGDAQNDIPMLQTAQIGVAMANAVSECKAAADCVTENDCDHSGVAEAIRKFL